MSKKLIVVFLVVGIFLSGCGDDKKISVYWGGTEEYEDKMENFNLNIENATNLIFKWEEENLEDSKKNNFDHIPKIIIGDYYYYYYGFISKKREPLIGYYVNGNTGQLEFRESEYTIPGSFWGVAPDTIPADVFDSVEVLIPAGDSILSEYIKNNPPSEFLPTSRDDSDGG